MPSSKDRQLALATAGFLILLTVTPGMTADTPPFSTVIALAEDPTVGKRLEAARDHLAVENWKKAADILQSVLDAGEDVFVPVRRRDRDGKERLVRVSARAEANRLLGDLPPKAQEFYRLTYGPQAAEILSGARKSGRVADLIEVFQRFRHTPAGAEATRRLAVYHLDRGRFPLAARYFRLALENERAPAPLLCFQAALAFRRAGDRANADWAGKLLSNRAPNGLRLGKRWLTPTDLRQRLEQFARQAPPAPAADWWMFRGDASRLAWTETSSRAGSAVRNWSQATAGQSDTLSWLRKAEQLQAASARPMLPASFPLLAGARLIYRSQRGVTAVDRSSGEILWEAPTAWGLDAITEDIDSYPHLSAWADTHLSRNPYLLVENSLLGTLSADRGRVYAVDDLPFPPVLDAFRSGMGLRLPLAPALTKAVYHNRLLAIDQASGKGVWQRGGRAAGDPLRDSYFLGPPLPLNGQLYALVEGEQDMSLVCLDAARGELVWRQRVAVPQKKLLLDGARRTYATPLAHADGILVCPTNAGAIVALDVLTRQLLWAHAYRKEQPPPMVVEEVPLWRRRRGRFQRLPPPGPLPDKSWRASSPIIHRGKVIFTAPDEPSVQCLDLRTGALRWRVEYSDGLFVAAAGDSVVVVGAKNTRAVRLADGKELWNLPTARPSGEGVLAGTIYFLPVRGEGKQPVVQAIDVERGIILARIPWPTSVPGNLLFVGGNVFSQTAGEVRGGAGRIAEPLSRATPDGAVGNAASASHLIERLGSRRYAEREAAGRRLRVLGEPAVKELRRAARDRDAEVRRRAGRLLRLIDQDLRAVRLLAPVRVRLVCKDTPVPVAVASLARKSGMPLQLAGDQAKLLTRKVTLDTGEVPFWEALDQLCAKAGLAEKLPEAPAQKGGGRSVIIFGGRRGLRQIQPSDIMQPESVPAPEPVVLTAGPPLKLPTHHAGSIRIRALPPQPAEGDQPPEIQLTLASTAGPRLIWDRAVAVRIHRALDDRGQSLRQVPAALQTDNAGNGRPAVVINQVPIRAPADRNQPRIPLRLERGEKPSKRLKELTGTVVAQVRTPPETLVVVDNVFRAVGRSIKGPHGGAVTVLEVKLQEGGKVRLRLQVEAPTSGVDDVPLPFAATIMIDGKVLGPHREALSAQNFALLAGGKPLPVVAAVNTGVRAGAAQVLELTYQAVGDKLDAARFVYSGRRTTIVKVPFTLKDVPLP